MILGTLAAGLAEAGRFAEAARVQREALGLLNDAKSKEDYSSRLKLYESNSPYRDTATNALAPAADDRLGMAALLRARGTLCAQFAQWTLAAGDLTKAIALNPDENWNWYQLGPLLLETGDTGGYRKHCYAMLARFGTTNDPAIAERTAKACLLLPLDGADLAAAAKLAETAVTLGKDDPSVAYYQFAKGLAEYRQANFAQAVEWTQKALRQPGTLQPGYPSLLRPGPGPASVEPGRRSPRGLEQSHRTRRGEAAQARQRRPGPRLARLDHCPDLVARGEGVDRDEVDADDTTMR